MQIQKYKKGYKKGPHMRRQGAALVIPQWPDIAQISHLPPFHPTT